MPNNDVVWALCGLLPTAISAVPPSLIKSPLLPNDHSKDPSTPRQKVRESSAGSCVVLFFASGFLEFTFHLYTR